ncbi:hypothetical protein KUTeg_013957 [Tegillarca granosa]|uniref:Uncharacterized protein n=1 Tax=Tegillarca granosa TaxID=220873 RepID=A0ABQ9EV76_TEGGR|nr:hypothetical protein KUTeg_013957 [Tegillarca granosa]
MWCVKNKG